LEKTLLLIKPDGVEKRVVGKIISMVEENKFYIKDIKMTKWSREEAEGFYYIHKGKPFFERLINFMTSGPVIGLLLEKENAVNDLRKLVGKTDPKEAEPGTIRALFGTNVTVNTVHASDSEESAAFEINYFFNEQES